MARAVRGDLKKEKFWLRMMRRQAGSGLSIRGWCHKHALHEHTFYWWRARLRRVASSRSAWLVRATPRRRAGTTRPRFVPVRVTQEPAANIESQIEIMLASGRRIQVHGRVDRQMLTDVLAVLEASPC